MSHTDTSAGKPEPQLQKPSTATKPTDGPIIKFPPFPTNTEGASIIPFKGFKEHGIRIFSDTGIEIDGLGIPTVELGVRHELDECKTETRRKLKVGKDLSEGKRGKIPMEEQVKLSPMERAKEQRMQRFRLFANKEWYDQWSEGEHLRGLNTYDPNLSSITRIHQAATEFRTGRIWPPAHTHLVYLWDQFRLYAGLLGSTPIWTRTDLPQPDGVIDEDENEVEEGPIRSSAHPRPRRSPNPDDEIDLASDFSDHELGDEFAANIISQTKRDPPQPPRKRVPPRTPYALYNKEPIPVSSDAEIHALLARAAVEKETKLLAFLNDPEKSVKVFLSSYMRKEGLIWTPSFLTYLPLLVSFFLSFLIRTRALPECERQLKRAVEIARQAATELPCAGRLCRILPDAVGKGARGCWGIKWEEKWDFGINDKGDPKTNGVPVLEEKLNKEDALKIFETEVKKANLQLLSKETMFGPEPLGQNIVNEASDDEEIGIQIMSPTSPEPKSPTTFISQMVNVPEAHQPTQVAARTWEKPNWAVAPNTTASHDSFLPPPPARPPSPPVGSASPDSAFNPQGKEPQISDDESEDSEEDPRAWASTTGRPPTRSQKLAEKAAWFPPATQPLMGVLGMTTLPLRYESGIAERSLRKVTSVLKPGEVGAGGSNKWRGVEEELVKRLMRIVLGPWPDWDDGGIAPEFKTPTLVGGGTSSPLDSTDGGNWKSAPIAHDPLKDDITILVEPNVANSLIVGMGVAGTWVQLIPLKSENVGGGRGRGRGGGDSRGRGRGGGGGVTRGKEQRFWYVEELSMAIPSFWTVGEEVEGIEADEEDIDNVERRWFGP